MRQRKGPARHGQPSPKNTTSATEYIAGTARRRAASRRLPVLKCGRSEPWHYPEPDERGYVAAVEHLLQLGMTPAPNSDGLRAMWRRGSHHRRDAARIAQAWELVQ